MTADLVARLQWMVADGRNMGVNEQTIDLDIIEQAASALRSSGEAVAWTYRCRDARDRAVIARSVEELRGNIDLYPETWERLHPLYLHPATPASAWRPIAEAALLTRNAVGVSGPCAVLLRIDTGRPGPFIRQGRFDAAVGAFVCDSTGQVLRDAIAFVEPEFPTPPTSTKA